MEYALADTDRSGSYLQKAADIVIDLGISVFDSASPMTSSRPRDRSIPSTGLNAIQVPEMELADDVRRCFWEVSNMKVDLCGRSTVKLIIFSAIFVSTAAVRYSNDVLLCDVGRCFDVPPPLRYPHRRHFSRFSTTVV
jgi:hypothetical protein